MRLRCQESIRKRIPLRNHCEEERDSVSVLVILATKGHALIFFACIFIHRRLFHE
jgi:hypothetical protein